MTCPRCGTTAAPVVEPGRAGDVVRCARCYLHMGTVAYHERDEAAVPQDVSA